MRKTAALAVFFLSGFTHALFPLAMAQDANRSASGDPAFEQALSPEQNNVWKEEQNLHLFEYQRDFKDYMSFWDAHFVGWPDYVQRPAGKPEIESGVVEEFKRQPTPSHPFIAPEPLGIAVFGDVGITHYFWPDADRTSPTVFRVTHTWQKRADGWHIIGGMSCEVPRFPASAATSTTAQDEQDVLKASRAWLDAFNRRDLDAVAHHLDEEFMGSTDDGLLMTKSRLLKRLATHPPELERREDVRDVRVHTDGDAATVNYLVTVREGGFEPNTLFFQFRRTEFFRKKNGAWVAIAAHESQLPVNHRVPAKADPATFKDYAGQYTVRPGFPATYTVVDGHLIDEFKGEKTEAFPMGNDSFFEREDLGWVTFLRDQQGGVSGYIYHYADGQDAYGRKVK